MGKNIVVLIGSPRRNGNTEILANAFIKGAEEAGNEVTKIHLSGLQVNGCTDCKYCFTHLGECSQQDDMQKIYPALYKADMVVFASPVYYYALSSQIKAVIDRFYISINKSFPISSSALLLTYADKDEASCEAALVHYKTLSYFMKWTDKGIISVSGVSNKGDINGNIGLEKAEALGKSIK